MFKSFKSKLAVVGASALVFANSAMAAITLSSTGEISGQLDVAPFMAIAGAVLLALASLWAVRQGIRLIK
ncbi:hypothetical protein LMG7974_00212 [Campylobacter majalis]|uniref:Phage coat protein n=1 Tax=Campylobacter majalis TaxID=2790656 RepID=A0ABN7K440_9BACT|nr:hypothetical protein [Campylobacter majalis]CAD7287274.1 hypothetical protein LMG7974_00212 [Campylobacter majalis]